MALFDGFKFKRAVNFVSYFRKRCKISGAQWNQRNVPQVLKHRCAYLNGLLDSYEYKHLVSI